MGPGEGEQACGDVGLGRMLEPIDIVDKIAALFETGLFSGKKILLTAGPTHEAIDPVRYITNASSGKMGYALAEAFIEAGAEVTLVSGPVFLTPPARAKIISVVSANQMLEAVMERVSETDIFCSVAAVADYRAKEVSSQKIAKKSSELTLELERNADIVASVANLEKKPFVIGFAAETENLLLNAKAKLKNKKLDMIIANQVGADIGIGSDENAVTVLWEEGEKAFPRMSKNKLARELVQFIADIFY